MSAQSDEHSGDHAGDHAGATPGSAAAVVMYTRSWCPYCERARALLKHKGVAFQEIDVEAQSGQLEEMVRRSGRQSVPQIFIGEHHVGGSDDLHALDAAGGLDRLLLQQH
jgi:glutaredoxin 3